jgi:hypothetical protein
MPGEKSDHGTAVRSILAALGGVIATVIFLESQDLIKHTEHKDDYALSQYKAIFIDQRDESSYRLSRKPSNQHAICVEGFLFLRADQNPQMQGLLVDYKNRGVKCLPQTLTGDATPENNTASATEDKPDS